MKTDFPRLETERLILRMMGEEDFPEYARMSADPEVMRFLGDGKPVNATDAWRNMASLIGHWQLRGYGLWAVEEKSSGKFVGRIGFYNPAGWPGFELGWTLARESWGKGYATEGARRALQFGFEDLRRQRIISLIDPANLPSIRVAERIGEKATGKMELLGHEVLIYAIDRDEWRRAK